MEKNINEQDCCIKGVTFLTEYELLYELHFHHDLIDVVSVYRTIEHKGNIAVNIVTLY